MGWRQDTIEIFVHLFSSLPKKASKSRPKNFRSCAQPKLHSMCTKVAQWPACKTCFKTERRHPFLLGGHSFLMELWGVVWQWPYSLIHSLGFRCHLQVRSYCAGGHHSISWFWCFREDQSIVSHCFVKHRYSWVLRRCEDTLGSFKRSTHWLLQSWEGAMECCSQVWNDPFTFWVPVSWAGGDVFVVWGT